MTPKEHACWIHALWTTSGPPERRGSSEYLIEILTSALTIPANHVRGPDGVDRKVLGTLPMTADGCVIGYEATLVCPDGHNTNRTAMPRAWCGNGSCWSEGCQGDSSSGTTHSALDCYSTRDAAIAARTTKTEAPIESHDTGRLDGGTPV